MTTNRYFVGALLLASALVIATGCGGSQAEKVTPPTPISNTTSSRDNYSMLYLPPQTDAQMTQAQNVADTLRGVLGLSDQQMTDCLSRVTVHQQTDCAGLGQYCQPQYAANTTASPKTADLTVGMYNDCIYDIEYGMTLGNWLFVCQTDAGSAGNWPSAMTVSSALKLIPTLCHKGL